MNHELVKFIQEARKRGFSDIRIKDELLKAGWPVDIIEDGFSSLAPRHQGKNEVVIYLDTDLLQLIEKRARKNMMTIPEQVEDVLRRSCINQKNKKATQEKLDDTLVGIFSRKNTGRKKKGKK